MSAAELTDCRALAARVIASVIQQKGSLATLLPDAMRRTSNSDKTFLQELCYGSLRHYYSLAAECSHYLQKPLRDKDSDIQALLISGAYQLQHMRIPAYAAINSSVAAAGYLRKDWAKGLVNAVLRKIQSQSSRLEPPNDEARYDHPLWFIEAVRASWPQQAESILSANNQRAPMTLRVNTRPQTRDDYLQRLAAAGIQAEPTTLGNAGIQLAMPLPVDALPNFANGNVSVQDEAAQLSAPLMCLEKGLRVLDACAAPGGKTCHLLETQPDISLLAIDREKNRCQLIQQNLQRLNLDATVLVADAAAPSTWKLPPGIVPVFDRILLDAPCSASGVIRHHPDIKLLRRASDIPALASAQLGLLRALWPLLVPGGLLLYVTCSILPAENDDVITNFLAEAEDVKVDKLSVSWGLPTGHGRQLLTERDGHDGFYYARLHKIVKG